MQNYSNIPFLLDYINKMVYNDILVCGLCGWLKF